MMKTTKDKPIIMPKVLKCRHMYEYFKIYQTKIKINI